MQDLTKNIPEESLKILKEIQTHYGSVPNIFQQLSASPYALKTYFSLAENNALCGLAKLESQVIYLRVAHEITLTFDIPSWAYLAMFFNHKILKIAQLFLGSCSIKTSQSKPNLGAKCQSYSVRDPNHLL